MNDWKQFTERFWPRKGIKPYQLLLMWGCLWAAFSGANQPVAAQIQDERWSTPYRLSSEDGESSRAVMATDAYGYLHVFWFERLPDATSILQYARFDGENWTEAIDIYFAPPGTATGDLSPAVDAEGQVYISWREGANGPLYFMYAFSHKTLSAHWWEGPVSVRVPARNIQFRVDEAGVFHILYTNTFSGQERGVYYVRSEDKGNTWSLPVWLDPDIPIEFEPQWPQLVLDDQGGLHAVWHYVNISPTGSIGQWVRYAHSLDGGFTWILPFTIDIADEEPTELRLPNPSIITEGDRVLVVWAGDSSTHREYRLSQDRGQTWGATGRSFGNLLGQAIGDGLAVDGNGRFHFVGQLRWPHGLYHAYWSGEQWTSPSLFYLIARDAFDHKGDRIHAHNVQLSVRGGNQLVSTFTTSPGDLQLILYASHRLLEDVPAQAPVPTPTPLVSVASAPTPTLMPATPTPNPLIAGLGVPSAPVRGAGFALWLGTLPSVLLVGFVIGVWWLRRLR